MIDKNGTPILNSFVEEMKGGETWWGEPVRHW